MSTEKSFIELFQLQAFTGVFANASERIDSNPADGTIAYQANDGSLWGYTDALGWTNIVSPNDTVSVSTSADAASRLALSASEGDLTQQDDDGSVWVYDGTMWLNTRPAVRNEALVADNYQALRDLGTPTFGRVFARTLNVLGSDRVEGDWYWVASSSAADDGATVLSPTGQVGNGRWLRILGNQIDSMWWGIDLADPEGSKTANTQALLNFWQFCATRSEVDVKQTALAPPSTVIVDQNNVFAQFTQSNIKGWVFQGSATWGSNNGSRFVLDDDVDSFYQTSPGDRKLISPTFKNIVFDGDDSRALRTTRVLFDPWSEGQEQFFSFEESQFNNCRTAIRLRGTANNAETRGRLCQFNFIGANNGAAVWVANQQSVNNLFVQCDANNLRGHLLRVGPEGGGGSTRWEGGNVVFEPDDLQGMDSTNFTADSSLVYFDGLNSNVINSGNNEFFVRAKVELQRAGKLLTWPSAANRGANNTAHVSFDVDIGTTTVVGPASRDLVTAGPGVDIDFVGGNYRDTVGGVYRLTAPLAPSAVSSYGSSLRFGRGTKVPEDIYDKFTFENNGGYALVESSRSNFDEPALFTANVLAATRFTSIGIEGIFDGPRGSVGSNGVARRLYRVAFNSTVTPIFGVTAPLFIGIAPPTARITRIRFEKPAIGSDAATYQLAFTLDPDGTPRTIARSAVLRIDEEMVVDWSDPAGIPVGPGFSGKTIQITSTSTHPGSAAAAGAYVRGFVEYVCE